MEATSVAVTDGTFYIAAPAERDPDQPWYRVLIDGADQSADEVMSELSSEGDGGCARTICLSSTHAAQASLEPDAKTTPVDNPWVSIFFTGFENGRHMRNGVRWPG